MKIKFLTQNYLINASIIAGFVGSIFLIFGVLNIFISSHNKSTFWEIPIEYLGNLGSLIAGISGSLFSLSGIFLIYEAIKKQREMFEIQQFENKFFELIKYHKENVSEITYVLPRGNGLDSVEGRKYFVEVTQEIDNLLLIIKEVLNNKYKEEILIKVAGTFHFIGSKKNKKELLFSQNSEIIKEDFDELFSIINEKKTSYNKSIVFFGGHRHRLDHYYRNIAQIIKFVDESIFLDDQKKMRYVKFFRAQLSDYELIYLFYQTFTTKGSGWIKNGYLEKYELIKNIEKILDSGIKPKDYFPKIIFDWEFTG